MASVSQFLAARLWAWDVDRVFGLPGRDVDALVTALTEGSETPEFVHVRHEESAALMACAHAKLTGRVGCCLASSGSGALHLLSGLYDAALDRWPVVAVVGQESPPPAGGRRSAIRTHHHFAEVSVYCEPVSDPTVVGGALDRAFEAALSERGVATLIVPSSVLEARAPRGLGADEVAPVRPSPPPRSPEQRDLRRAADVLNAGSRVAVVVGPGAARASGHVVGVAELLAAGVAKTPPARDILPDDLPYVAGVAGPFGSAVAAALVRDCDTLLLIGAEDFDVGPVPESGARRIVTVDADAESSPEGGDAAPDVRLTGDVATTLEMLIPLLHRKSGRGWRTNVERAIRAWHAEGHAKAHRFFGMAINPRSVVAELSARLPDRSVVITDSGSALDWWSRHLELRNAMRSILSGHLATPGAAVPYAVAARLAFPERPVIALVGDGALQAGGMNELITVRRHLERFAALPPTIFCVFNNEDLSRLTWERRKAAGDPRIPETGEVPAVSYTQYARLLGLPGVRCDRPAQVAAAWEDALAGRGPMLLEFMVDGDTPPDWAEPDGSVGARGPSLRLRAGGSLRRRISAAIGGVFGLTR
ncbi:thiamine pyrophosphate-requiring protein [Streptomyces sp. TRM72054]|uniref:thiamine pyrophosphate-binding protein n=1 Tax=Streptomyces sp. TRM72054 TaxID=2870562 RepID=UPI001C8C08C8|nr:thiamine pyrophosphate-binding protein [Streptomyces sp. TRM72054]MBX9397430.1 thiamine pyrophosphate-requiring protein [Streptomyces sp. TRM72054]